MNLIITIKTFTKLIFKELKKQCRRKNYVSRLGLNKLKQKFK